MTASEQRAEYAATHTPTIGAKIRAAIEADVLRRVADIANAETLYRVVWGAEFIDFDGVSARDAWTIVVALQDHLRAEADRIEHATRPTPEGDPR